MKYLPILRNFVTRNILAKTLLACFLIFATVISFVDAKPIREREVIMEVAQPKVKHVDPKQLDCLAKNIFFEAGAEPLEGKAAVARVVMNRVQAGFGPNPCTVVYQVLTVLKPNEDTIDNTEDLIKVRVCQFSWVCEGKGSPNKNSNNYRESYKVAYNVLAHDAYSNIIPATTLFFHNIWVDPVWPYKQVAKIGNHIFYEKLGRKRNQKNTENFKLARSS
jgi:spore germination cell wall hydrolase CwlJ-like protein